MSNGTNNLVDLDLINGEKIKLFFKIDYENQVEELQPFIITLIKNEILTREEGVKILNINTDYRYDKFITEVNKKSLINQALFKFINDSHFPPHSGHAYA